MLCVTKGRAGNIDVPKSFGAQKIVVHPRCQSGIKLQDLELLCWALVLIKYGCSYALVLLFQSKKVVNLFGPSYPSHYTGTQFRDFDYFHVHIMI